MKLARLEMDKSAVRYSEGAEVSVPNPLIRKFSDDNSRFDTDEVSPSGAFGKAVMDKGVKVCFPGSVPSPYCVNFSLFLCSAIPISV